MIKMEEQIHPMPLSIKGKVMVILIMLLLSMWIFAIYAYLTLPQEVPAHFGFSGEPTRYGDKSTFLGLPAAFISKVQKVLTWASPLAHSPTLTTLCSTTKGILSAIRR